MLRAAVVFFVIGLIAMVLGLNNFAGVSLDVGKTLLFIFLILAVVSFIWAMITGQRPHPPT